MTEQQYNIAKNSVIVSTAVGLLRQVSIGQADEYGVSQEQFAPILKKLIAMEDWLLRCSFVQEEG